jgi:hypothetical protein
MIAWRLGALETAHDLGSEANFSMVRDWYSTCLAEHKECFKTMGDFIPTRLIDVGTRNSSHNPRLVICSESTEGAGTYLALSHCWGGDIDFKTTVNNLHCMRAEISMTNMPQNFRDAVEITQKLGFRYIWIDSLCIVQDSVKDWEVEAARMGDLYANAAITIAATVAQNSNAGILKQMELDESLFQIDFDDDPAPEDVLIVYPKDQAIMRRKNGEENIFRLIQPGYGECILASRGWTLQERILSRRMVHYGSQKIFWSCCESQLAADDADSRTDVKLHYRVPFHSPVIKQQQSSSDQQLQLYNDWYEWLSDYTTFRKLTNPSDKLPALSGIVSYISRISGDRYLAGIWLGDLCRGLIWQRSPAYPYQRAEPPRGPSWSWVNFDCGVGFIGRDLKVLEVSINVIDYSVDLKGANPFGEVLSAKLVLEAPILELDSSWRGSLRRTKPEFLETIWDYEDVSEESGIWGSRAVLMIICKTVKSEIIETPEPQYINTMGIQVRIPELPAPEPPGDVLQGLILREVEGQPDVFQRIGQVVLDNVGSDYLPGEEDTGQEFRLRQLTII